MIELFIYRVSDGYFMSKRTGSIDVAIECGQGFDFTLEPLPDTESQWYWYNNQWNKDPA